MMNQLTSIVRSNQNAVMFRVGTESNSFYTIFDVRERTYTYTGTLNACKKAWNRHYRNSRQFVTGNGVNHRYIGN